MQKETENRSKTDKEAVLYSTNNQKVEKKEEQNNKKGFETESRG